ncbi:MAG: phage portal protein [Chloroflexi bacterium]|nr:phage portal protein [Chloroflexota bacterium]
MNGRERLRARLAGFLSGLAERLAVSVQVDDKSPGWTSLGTRPNDRPWGEQVELYRDALEAWRKNPLAKSIVDITSDFVVGDGIELSSPRASLQKFLSAFWNHPKNLFGQRLHDMSDELARAGDLFILLFRNPEDGLSYVRFVTKEQIVAIETAENDWETEVAYHVVSGETGFLSDPTRPQVWLSPHHPGAKEAAAVMLHYAINRPIGASFGEGDLATVLVWLQRYSRMLEDRVRMHWAVRAFLWFIKVPTHKVEEKKAQYAAAPESGSVIVHDDAETWDVKAPALHAADARHDLQAVRQMIDAAGYPPHWRGESGDANLATATAMQVRPERHLKRRQDYMVFVLQDLVLNAYRRALEIGKVRGVLPVATHNELLPANVTDVSRSDNQALATAGRELMAAMKELLVYVPPAKSPTLARLTLKLLFRFIGEPVREDVLDQVMSEAFPASEAPAAPGDGEEEMSGAGFQVSGNGHGGLYG